MINKIFFCDGAIEYGYTQTLPFDKIKRQIEAKQDTPLINFCSVDALWGVSSCIEQLEMLQSSGENYYVLTNFLQALDSKWINTVLFAKSPTHKIKEMFYLWVDGQWAPIEQLTEKELRYSHNIVKMYLAGYFNRDD